MLRLISRSSTLVLPVNEAVEHIRRTDTAEDDALIERYIKAATLWAENFTGRAFIDQTWDYTFDTFPMIVSGGVLGRGIRIPKPPLLEIEGVFARDISEVEFSSFLIDYATPSIYLSSTGAWPNIDVSPNAVRIRFRAGYVDESGSPGPDGEVPEDIKAAIAIYTATLYENREYLVTGTVANVVPWGAEELLRMYRVVDSMA